jgi:hypothetical protein
VEKRSRLYVALQQQLQHSNSSQATTMSP